MTETIEDYYTVGFLAGSLTMLTIIVPCIIIVSFLLWLPMFPQMVGLVIFGIALIFVAKDSVRHLERFYRNWLMKREGFKRIVPTSEEQPSVIPEIKEWKCPHCKEITRSAVEPERCRECGHVWKPLKPNYEAFNPNEDAGI